MAIIKKLFGLIYLFIGLYLLNMFFGFIPLDFLGNIGNWILFIAGVIIIIHAIIFFFKNNSNYSVI